MHVASIIGAMAHINHSHGHIYLSIYLSIYLYVQRGHDFEANV